MSPSSSSAFVASAAGAAAAAAEPLPRRSVRLLAAVALGAALSGCVVAPVGRPIYRGDPSAGGYPGDPYGGDVVTVQPPAPQYEVVGVPPVAGYIWIGGHWRWGGARFAWSPGYWSAPRPGHRWYPHAWVPHGRGWRLNQGHWGR